MSSGRLWLWAFGMVVVAFLIAPIFVIIIVSFNDTALFSFPPTAWSLRWYRALWDSRSWRDAGALSLYLAVAVTIASLLAWHPRRLRSLPLSLAGHAAR